MRAVLPPGRGSAAGKPALGEWPDPVPGVDEVLVRVAAAGLNRADLLQMRGLYPPPPGESEIPGLECAGEVVAAGSAVGSRWQAGDRVLALLAGGGQAELVAIPHGQLMRLPRGLSLVEAAALPEAAITAWTNLVGEGHLEAGETVLIVGAASGVGTFAVQLAREIGATVLVAGRSLERLAALRELGADELLELKPDLGEQLRQVTGGRGVHLVLDLVGGGHVASALAGIAPGGRWVLVGLMAGRSATLDLGLLLERRVRLIGSVLRPRSRAEKAELVEAFVRFASGRLDDGRLRAVVDSVYPWANVADAYGRLERGPVLGKVVLDLA